MIINGEGLLTLEPIKDMETTKAQGNSGVSHGLTEAGYDIRLKQEITFIPAKNFDRVSVPLTADMRLRNTEVPIITRKEQEKPLECFEGRFVLASAVEEFIMPPSLVGVVHDKSTWARAGLSVFNTVIEPGWKGFLTLELVFHGNEVLHLPSGSGIAQVLFHRINTPSLYEGKYQNQPDEPTKGIKL